MEPMVRIVVLNFNGGDHVLRCVDSLLHLDWPKDRLEVVVVDNASDDGSPELVEARFPSARVVRNEENSGFSANNLALEDLEGVDYVGLVNPDSRVDRDWLRALVATLEADHGLGAACPRMLLETRFVDIGIDTPRPVELQGVQVDGEDWLATCLRMWRLLPTDLAREPDVDGVVRVGSGQVAIPIPRDRSDPDVAIVLRAHEPTDLSIDGRRHTVGPEGTRITVSTVAPYDVVNNTGVVLLPRCYASDRGLGDRADVHDPPSEVFGWTGGGVLLRGDYLRDVGLFDDLFFLYYEDVDLSWRGRVRGWSYRYAPDAVMWHHHAASSDQGSDFFRFHNERSRLVVVAKHAPARLLARVVILQLRAILGHLRADAIRPLVVGRHPSVQSASVRARAMFSLTRQAPRLLAARRSARAERTRPVDVATDWISESI